MFCLTGGLWEWSRCRKSIAYSVRRAVGGSADRGRWPLPGVQPCLPSGQAASRAQGADSVALACAASGREGHGRRIADSPQGTSSGEDGVLSGRAGSHATIDESSGSAVDHTRKWLDATLFPDVACALQHDTHALATILSEPNRRHRYCKRMLKLTGTGGCVCFCEHGEARRATALDRGESAGSAHTGQAPSSSLANRQGLHVSSSVVQACMPWRAAPRNAKRDETAGCGLRSMEPA